MTKWQDNEKRTITRRERFCRLYDFEKVDRGVRWEAVDFWRETIDEWKAAGGFPSNFHDAMEYYGLDPRPFIGGGLGFTSFSLAGPKVKERVIRKTSDTQVLENDLGARWRVRTNGTSMPQWIRFPVESHADWLEKIKPRLKPEDHPYGDLDKEVAPWLSGNDPICLALLGLYAFWRSFWGEEKLAYAFYDFPETLHDMANNWLAIHCECIPKVMAKAPFDLIFFHEDMAFKNGPLIGPHLFDQFMMPYYRQLFAHLRRLGLRRFMLDSDGNNGKVLDQFIELGMNGLVPFEVAAGCDVLDFREKHPDFVIFGGIDKRVLLKTKEDVKREVMTKVPHLWETGGFIPSIDHNVPPCPQENFEYFLELVRDLCR